MLLASLAAVVLVALAAPAHAQTGTLAGKVVFDDGRPAAATEVVLDFVGDIKRQVKTITDKNGEWVRPGLQVGGGTWTITAKRDKLEGSAQGIKVSVGQTTKVPDIVLLTEEQRASGRKIVAMNAEAAAAVAKKQAETDKLLNDVNAAITAGNDDEAITKLKALVEAEPNCASCFVKLGELYVKKNDAASAEAAFLKAIELDPAKPAPYSALANIYNQQRKFDEATKMSAKATELMGTAGAADAATVFNQGVILWNQSKVAEAKAQWAKTIQIDPKMADAHYWLGMANLSEAKTADARAAFEQYLKLAPTGQYADTAKQILATIK
jgi:cytochrome c-type biogenesis protein CcmH/NrfG